MKFLNPPLQAFLDTSITVFKFSLILWAVFVCGAVSAIQSHPHMPFYLSAYVWSVWLYPVVCLALIGLTVYTNRKVGYEVETLRLVWLLNVTMGVFLAYDSLISLFPVLMTLAIPLALVFRRIPKNAFAIPAFFVAQVSLLRKARIEKPAGGFTGALPSQG